MDNFYEKQRSRTKGKLFQNGNNNNSVVIDPKLSFKSTYFDYNSHNNQDGLYYKTQSLRQNEVNPKNSEPKP
jgi:hypothetical protein